jgi:hypothetical protein
MPQRGSERFNRDRRIIFVCVIVSYLLYTIYEVDWDIRRRGDFYLDLGLDFNAEDKAIQSRFRRLYGNMALRCFLTWLLTRLVEHFMSIRTS